MNKSGLNDAVSDDGLEPDWAPAGDPDSPNYFGDHGDGSGSRKLNNSKKKAKGTLRILKPFNPTAFS